MSQQTLSGRINALFNSATRDLANLREQISDLKQQRDKIALGRLTKNETIQRLNEFVDNEAAGFDAKHRFANAAATSDATPRDITGFHVWQGDAGPLLCWLLGDAIKFRFAELVEECGIPEGLPANKRAEAIRELDTRIYALEVAEEAVIMDAEAAGMTIPRREDCDPRVVLEVKG